MALTELDTPIHSANTNQAKLYSVFFELENAFPRVWRHLILTTLYKYGLRGQLSRLLQNSLTDRFFQVRVGGHLSSVHTQDNGIPHGSPLSGTLFLVAINDILSGIPYPVKPLLFEDDLSIHMQSGCARHVPRILQSVIGLIEEWLSSRGYRILLSKTEMIICIWKEKIKNSASPSPPWGPSHS